MLELVHSDRLVGLAGELVADLDRDDPSRDPLRPRPIVVPNRRVGEFLLLSIARARGIAANFEFPFLDRYLGERIEAAFPGCRVLDRPLLRALLLSVLDDGALLSGAAFGDIARYLAVDGDERGEQDAARVRQFQLADRVAGLFVDYARLHPEIIAAWRDGRGAPGAAGAPAERWQRELWRAVFGDGGIAARLAAGPDRPWDTLAGLVARLPTPALARELTAPVIVFGFSYLDRAEVAILRTLAAHAPVRLYALNPCREFWEDIGDDERDAPALRLWGRAGRDSVRMLHGATRSDFRDAFSDPEAAPATALGQLQRQILARGRADAPLPADSSIQIVACPSIRRELEVIANHIWAAIRADDRLRFNDIAVLLAGRDVEIYQAHVASVFGELGDIPCSVSDMPLTSESRILEALGLLLDLPLGRFTRPELLRLMLHPAVQARLGPGAGDIDRDDWIQWTQSLGIVHGADRADHEHTYIEGDRYHWDQGLCRLALGACMAGEPSGIRDAVSLGRSAAYLPLELAGHHRPSAARLGLAARSLIADARRLRRARLPLAEWAQVFDDLATAYLGPQSDDDIRSIERARDALAALASVDVEGRPIDYITAREHARAQLEPLRGSRGELGADGVVVAPLGPMRALPFRIAFVAGLGEGLFPAEDPVSTIDVRPAGDVGARDRDRYSFLETITSARDQLVLSYVCRDQRTGERRQPSSVVVELCQILGHDPTVEHPLRRHDDRYFGDDADLSSVDPVGRRQARSIALRRDLVHHLDRRELDLPDRRILARAVRDRPLLAEHIGLVDLPPPPAASEPDDAVALSIDQLRKFLECPMQAWAATVLRMREVEVGDPVALADEPFARRGGAEMGMLRDVFVTALRAGATTLEDVADHYRRRVGLEELAGRAPTGLFAAIESDRHREILGTWLDALGDRPTPAQLMSLGRAREHADVDQVLPPLALDAGGRRVELYGDLLPIAGAAGTLMLTTAKTLRHHHDLRAMFDHAVTAAAEIETGARRATIAGKARSRRLRLHAWQPDAARAYLGSLAGELLGGAHDYLLPCEAVLDWAKDPRKEIARAVVRLRDTDREFGFSSRWGPVARIDELEPPPEPEALVERRFRALLDRVEREGDAR